IAVPLFALSSGGSSDFHDAASLEGNSLGAISLTNGRIAAAIPLAGSPNAVASGARSVWVALPNRGVVERIDTATNTLQQTIVTPGEPSAVAVGGGFVWVAESLAGTVVQIDPRANGGQTVGKISVGNGPSGIAFGFGALWVANSVDHTVVRLNPETAAK